LINVIEVGGNMLDYAFFGENARFHHIGLAVNSIQNFTTPDSEIWIEKRQGVAIGFIRLYGITIELLQPLGENSPIARSLRQGIKLLHLCYDVPELERAVEVCRPAGFHILGPPAPAPVLGSQKVAWVFSKQYGLFELFERNAL
jgi:catechol 2,3-dioxygenase-like lactoylglutathione lyase family enzyme